MDVRPRVTRGAEAVLPTEAAPTSTPPTVATPTAPVQTRGAFAGSFAGTAYGDNDSSAPITLDLTHRNAQVAGNEAIVSMVALVSEPG